MQVGLILAGGSGSRMGQPKATLEINGERLIDRAIARFHQAGIEDVYVVLGAWQGDVPGAHVVINSEWQEGMGSSLRAGLLTISEDLSHSDVVISLVDLPGMTAGAIQTIAQSPHEIAMGVFGGKAGHPVKFSRKYWPEIIASAQGDIGARNFLKGRDDIDLIALDGVASGRDIDTPEDFEEFTTCKK